MGTILYTLTILVEGGFGRHIVTRNDDRKRAPTIVRYLYILYMYKYRLGEIWHVHEPNTAPFL